MDRWWSDVIVSWRDGKSCRNFFCSWAIHQVAVEGTVMYRVATKAVYFYFFSILLQDP